MKKTFSKDGTPIAYEKIGQGKPVILIDGAMMNSQFGSMTSLASLLSKHFTVFYYDRRGRNESGDTQPYAVEREIEDIAALVHEAGGSASLYGISSGAGLAVLATASGLNIDKLAVYEPPYFGSSSDAQRLPKDATGDLTRLIKENRRGDAVEYFMVDMVGQPRESVPPMRSMPMWAGLEAVAHTLPYDAQVMGDWKVPEQARYIKVPTLVMDGGDSPAAMRQGVQTLAHTIPDAQYRTIPGQTHAVASEAIAPVLIEFFSTEKTVARREKRQEERRR